MFTFGFYARLKIFRVKLFFVMMSKKMQKSCNWLTDQQKTERKQKECGVHHLVIAQRGEINCLSNNVAAVSGHNCAAQWFQQWIHRMGSRTVLDITGSRAVLVEVAKYETETGETSLDNGNKGQLKLTPQETDQS
jgi:hypothetical protein